jgi:hypothetical protein
VKWNLFPVRQPTPLALRMIRAHSRWLTRALRRRFHVPRIPVRKVSDGGFTALMSTHSGRRRAAEWWEAALEEATLE